MPFFNSIFSYIYRCVSTLQCLGDVATDPNMKAVCEAEFIETRSLTPQVCCKDIKVPAPKCSDPKLADAEYR